MRSAEQLNRTVPQWHDYQRAQREKALSELLGLLRVARERHDGWYEWVLALHEQRHWHAMDERGKRLACPVRGCDL